MLFVLMMFSECSSAGFNTGNELAEMMSEAEKLDSDNSKDVSEVGGYYGYVTGVADATDYGIWCAPSHLKSAQIVKVVSKYLNNNPEKLHLNAAQLVIEALIGAFPCKK